MGLDDLGQGIGMLMRSKQVEDYERFPDNRIYAFCIFWLEASFSQQPIASLYLPQCFMGLRMNQVTIKTTSDPLIIMTSEGFS